MEWGHCRVRSAKERRRQGQTDRAAWYWGRNQGQTPRRVRSDVPPESRGTRRLSSVKEEEQGLRLLYFLFLPLFRILYGWNRKTIWLKYCLQKSESPCGPLMWLHNTSASRWNMWKQPLEKSKKLQSWKGGKKRDKTKFHYQNTEPSSVWTTSWSQAMCFVANSEYKLKKNPKKTNGNTTLHTL